jgi:hypothetical protein
MVPTCTQDGVAGSLVRKYLGARFDTGGHEAVNVFFILRGNDKYTGTAGSLLLFCVALPQYKDGALVLVLVLRKAQVYPFAFLVICTPEAAKFSYLQGNSLHDGRSNRPQRERTPAAAWHDIATADDRVALR